MASGQALGEISREVCAVVAWKEERKGEGRNIMVASGCVVRVFVYLPVCHHMRVCVCVCMCVRIFDGAHPIDIPGPTLAEVVKRLVLTTSARCLGSRETCKRPSSWGDM